MHDDDIAPGDHVTITDPHVDFGTFTGLTARVEAVTEDGDYAVVLDIDQTTGLLVRATSYPQTWFPDGRRYYRRVTVGDVRLIEPVTEREQRDLAMWRKHYDRHPFARPSGPEWITCISPSA